MISIKNILNEKSIEDLKVMYYLYTFKVTNIKSKKKILTLLDKYIVNSKLYNNYTQLYSTLSNVEKDGILYYQSNEGYKYINNYLRDNNIDNKFIKNNYNKCVNNDKLIAHVQHQLDKNNKNITFNATIVNIVKKELKENYLFTKQRYEELKTKTISNINILSKIFNKFVLFDDIIVFRGIHPKNYQHLIKQKVFQTQSDKYYTKMRKLKENMTYTEKGISSCSFLPNIALMFSGTDNCCIFRYFLKKGSPCFIYPIDSSYREYEIILPPLQYRVKKIHTIKFNMLKYKIIDIDVIKFLKL